MVFSLDLRRCVLGLFPIGPLGIHQNKERLMELFQFLDGPLLRRYVVFSFQFPEAAVRGHHDSYGGMVVDNLLGADLRRLSERDLIFKPGGFYQPFFIVLHVPGRTVHHEAHTVHQAHLYVHIPAQRDLGSFLGNEFGFCCGNCFPA